MSTESPEDPGLSVWCVSNSGGAGNVNGAVKVRLVGVEIARSRTENGPCVRHGTGLSRAATGEFRLVDDETWSRWCSTAIPARFDDMTMPRFQSLKAARDAWKQVVAESGWKPDPRPVDVDRARRRENMERWARNRAG